MGVEENLTRMRIVSEGQHPLRHSAYGISFSHPSMPGVNTLGAAFNWFCAVLYPQALDDAVATPGDLPGSPSINDYAVVLDDGDGKAAGYRYFAKEGQTPAWHKVADMDWSTDSVLSGFYLKTLEMYVAKYGYDDLDEDGEPVTGVYAGQSIYGGKSPNTHLTLFANAGDGEDPATGFVQVGDHFRPAVDDSFSCGTLENRFSQFHSIEAKIDSLNLAAGSITDDTGQIDFDDEDLATDGEVSGAAFLALDGLVSAPSFAFQGEGNSGFYRAGAGDYAMAILGARVGSFKSYGFDLKDGSAAAPSLTFSDTTSGFYSPGVDQVGLATAGVRRILVDASGNVTFGTANLYVDRSNSRIGVGTVSPQRDLHLYGSAYAIRVESQSNTAADAPVLEFYRARASNANLAANDEVLFIDGYGRAGGTSKFLSLIQTRYVGDGTTQRANMYFGVANDGDPTSQVTLKYNGNFGLGMTDPSYKLHVVGDFAVDNIKIDGNTISSLDNNGSIDLAPHGTGWVTVSGRFFPTTNGTLDIGATGARFQSLYLSGDLGDGSGTVAIANLVAFGNWGTPAAGDTLFWDGAKWVASVPDLEVDHGTISGLDGDDHSQYALLAGRGSSQTLKGGTGANDDLYLESTAHATKGNIFTIGHLAPMSDATWDVGGSGASYRNLYLSGQAIGLRIENYASGGEPAASAGTAGRLYWDTTTKAAYVDRGGAWKKASLWKHVVQDAVTWNGVAVTQTYDVSADVYDARQCIWGLKKNGDSFKQIGCDITCTQTHVTVTVEVPLDTGTYTLVGVG